MRFLSLINIATPGGQDMSPEPTSLTTPRSSVASKEKVLVKRLVPMYLIHAGLLYRDSQQQQQQQQQGTDPQTAEVSKALLKLTDEYESRYKQELEKIVASWEVSAEDPRGSFKEVLDTVFLDDCNWGRIVTMFIFIRLFAEKCSGRQDASLSQVADWAVDYLTERKLGDWIREHGGWMGLVRFYQDGDADAVGQPLVPEESGLLRRLVTVAGAGLALATLGHLLTNRA